MCFTARAARSRKRGRGVRAITGRHKTHAQCAPLINTYTLRSTYTGTAGTRASRDKYINTHDSALTAHTLCACRNRWNERKQGVQRRRVDTLDRIFESFEDKGVKWDTDLEEQLCYELKVCATVHAHVCMSGFAGRGAVCVGGSRRGESAQLRESAQLCHATCCMGGSQPHMWPTPHTRAHTHTPQTFLLAGHETSAAMLTWSVYEMSRNPEIGKKVGCSRLEWLDDIPLQLGRVWAGWRCCVHAAVWVVGEREALVPAKCTAHKAHTHTHTLLLQVREEAQRVFGAMESGPTLRDSMAAPSPPRREVGVRYSSSSGPGRARQRVFCVPSAFHGERSPTTLSEGAQ